MLELLAAAFITAVSLHFTLNSFFFLYALFAALGDSDLLWVVAKHKYFVHGEGVLFLSCYLLSLVIVYFKL